MYFNRLICIYLVLRPLLIQTLSGTCRMTSMPRWCRAATSCFSSRAAAPASAPTARPGSGAKKLTGARSNGPSPAHQQHTKRLNAHWGNGVRKCTFPVPLAKKRLQMFRQKCDPDTLGGYGVPRTYRPIVSSKSWAYVFSDPRQVDLL